MPDWLLLGIVLLIAVGFSIWVWQRAIGRTLAQLQRSVADLKAQVAELQRRNESLRRDRVSESSEVDDSYDASGLDKEQPASPDEPNVRPSPSKLPRKGRIKHLVVTVGGERWVTEYLPKDDYRESEPTPPSVCALISKPLGYRLNVGYHILDDDDDDYPQPVDLRLIAGYHMLNEDDDDSQTDT